MSCLATSATVLACVFGGALLGITLRSVLPAQHLSTDSKDIVRLSAGLVGTIAALVLGLLVASAKGSYDSQASEVTQMSAQVALLDRLLAHYGADAGEARGKLRATAVRMAEQLWPADQSATSDSAPSAGGETIYEAIQKLSPKDDVQRAIQGQAVTIALGLAQTRWLMYEQSATPVPMPMLVVLVLWLTVIFLSFGLFAPRNATVVISLFVSAMSVSCAILLILEMYRPFAGLIQISDAPLRAAIAHLGR